MYSCGPQHISRIFKILYLQFSNLKLLILVVTNCYHRISVPAFSFVLTIVQMPNESQIESRTNLEREKTVGELSHHPASGSGICSARGQCHVHAGAGSVSLHNQHLPVYKPKPRHKHTKQNDSIPRSISNWIRYPFSSNFNPTTMLTLSSSE